MFPFRVDGGLVAALSIASLAAIGWVGWRADAVDRPRAPRRFAIAAALVAGPVLSGEALAFADYSYSREVRARRLIDALDRYVAREEFYPDALEALLAEEVGPRGGEQAARP